MKGEDYGMSLEEALTKLEKKGEHYIIIYNEMKDRGLLKEDERGNLILVK